VLDLLPEPALEHDLGLPGLPPLGGVSPPAGLSVELEQDRELGARCRSPLEREEQVSGRVRREGVAAMAQVGGHRDQPTQVRALAVGELGVERRHVLSPLPDPRPFDPLAEVRLGPRKAMTAVLHELDIARKDRDGET
tara:strand:+ start:608 stop:1021 length:414 start_codon:yes stop_codon:yes gene_type:complete